MSCQPCESRKVGTCILKTLGFPGTGCAAERSECIIGRCVCFERYCAGATGTTCEPQVCARGARPPGFHPSVWIAIFAALGAEREFPPLDETHERWLEYVVPTCFAAVAAMCVGGFVALGVTIFACCGHRYEVLCCSRNDIVSDTVLCALVHNEDDDPPSDAKVGLRGSAGRAPVMRPLLQATFVLLLLSALCVLVRRHGWHHTVEIIDQSLASGHNDSLFVVEHVRLLNETVTSLEKGFSEMADCKHNPMMRVVGSQALVQAEENLGFLRSLYHDVEPLPRSVEALRTQVHELEVYGEILPNAPEVVVCLVALFILIEASMARRLKQRCAAECFMITLFAVVVLFIAICIASEMQFGVGGGQVCYRLDARVLSFLDQQAKDYNMSDLYDVGRFYLRDDIYNPLFRYAEMAVMYVDQIHDLYVKLKVHYDTQAISCPAMRDFNIPGIAANTHVIANGVYGSMRTAKVYPSYDKILRGGLCNHVLPTLGQLMTLQVAMGLICFPVCTLLAHRYLEDCVASSKEMRRDLGGGEAATDARLEEEAAERKPRLGWDAAVEEEATEDQDDDEVDGDGEEEEAEEEEEDDDDDEEENTKKRRRGARRRGRWIFF